MIARRLLYVVIALLSGVATAGAQDVEASAKVGMEVDSNPERTSAGSEPDGAGRFLISVSGDHTTTDVLASAALTLGGRALARESEENTFLAALRARLGWRMSEQFSFGVMTSWKDRVDEGALRDYTRSDTRGWLRWSVERTTLSLSAGYTTLVFKPSLLLSATGPAMSSDVAYQVSDPVRLQVRFSLQRRDVDESRTLGSAAGEPVPVLGEARVDWQSTLGVTAEYRSSQLLADATASLTQNLSNSFGRGFTRTALVMSATLPIGASYVRAGFAFRRTNFRDPVLVDQTFMLEDENRNQVSVQWGIDLSDVVGLEARYSGFFQAFSGDDREQYARHLMYGGVVIRPRSADDSVE